MLPAGGSEFFNALLEVESPVCEHARTPLPRASSGRELFIVGTATQSARKFVTAERLRKTPVFALPQELAWGAEFTLAAVEAVAQRVVAALATQPRVILGVGLPPVRDAEVAQRLSNNVVSVAA